MGSNASNKSAAQRERDRRAAAKAKRQAAKAGVPEPAAAEPSATSRVSHEGSPGPRAVVARKEPAGIAPDLATAVPRGDQRGEVATWMMLAVLVLMGMLAVAVVAAS